MSYDLVVRVACRVAAGTLIVGAVISFSLSVRLSWAAGLDPSSASTTMLQLADENGTRALIQWVSAVICMICARLYDEDRP